MKANIGKTKIDHSVEDRPSSKAGRRVVLLALLPLLLGVLTGLLVLSRGQYGSSPEKHSPNPEQAVETVALEIPVTSRNTIQLRSRAYGHPLPDCTVRYLLEGSGVVHEAVTDQEGKAALPVAGRYLLDIFAEGYVGVRGVYTIAPQGGIFPLSRAGSLEIRFVDEQGYPVENADALLLPPVASGPNWGDQWQREFDWNQLETYDFLFEELLSAESFASEQRFDLAKRRTKKLFSDDPEMDRSGKRTISSRIRAASRRMQWRKVAADSGRILWSELPAGDGYRWGLLSEQNLAVIPAHENQGKEFLPSGNGWKTGYEAPAGLSGMFSIRAGETTSLTVRIYNITSIRGTLVPGMGTFFKPAKVRLHDRKILSHEGISPLTLVEQAAAVYTEKEGRFFFEGVTPGPKQIKAVWIDQNQNIYLYKILVNVPEGGTVDLGMIYPMKGKSLHGVVDFQDREGRVVPASDLFGPGENQKAILTLNNLAGENPGQLNFMATLQLEVEKPFSIHGLSEGTWRLQAKKGNRGSSPKPGYLLIRAQPKIELEMPRSEDIRLSFPVERGREVQISVRFQQGEDPVGMVGELRSLTSERTYPIRLHSDSRGEMDIVSRKIRIPTDHYQIHLRSKSEAAQPGFFVKNQIHIESETREIHVTAHLAASIDGKFLCSHGDPIRERVVVFHSRNGSSYTSRTDAEGNFRIAGLEPFEELTSELTHTRIRSGNSGSRRKVEVRSSFH